MKKFLSQHMIGDFGESLVSARFIKDLNFIYRENHKRDTGVDGEIEICYPIKSSLHFEASGKLLKAQIKCTTQNPDANGDFTIKFSAKDKNYLFKGLNLPAIIILVDFHSEKIMWQLVSVKNFDKKSIIKFNEIDHILNPGRDRKLLGRIIMLHEDLLFMEKALDSVRHYDACIDRISDLYLTDVFKKSNQENYERSIVKSIEVCRTFAGLSRKIGFEKKYYSSKNSSDLKKIPNVFIEEAQKLIKIMDNILDKRIKRINNLDRVISKKYLTAKKEYKIPARDQLTSIIRGKRAEQVTAALIKSIMK